MRRGMNADPKSIPATGVIDFAMTPQAFRAKHFEKAHLLLRGALRTSFSWSDVDEILHRADPLPPYFQLFHNGEIPPQEFVDELRDGNASRPRISKAKFYEHLRKGATAVINRAELLSTPA